MNKIINNIPLLLTIITIVDLFKHTGQTDLTLWLFYGAFKAVEWITEE